MPELSGTAPQACVRARVRACANASICTAYNIYVIPTYTYIQHYILIKCIVIIIWRWLTTPGHRDSAGTAPGGTPPPAQPPLPPDTRGTQSAVHTDC